jgi:hypothetical protein
MIQNIKNKVDSSHRNFWSNNFKNYKIHKILIDIKIIKLYICENMKLIKI